MALIMPPTPSASKPEECKEKSFLTKGREDRQGKTNKRKENVAVFECRGA